MRRHALATAVATARAGRRHPARPCPGRVAARPRRPRPSTSPSPTGTSGTTTRAARYDGTRRPTGRGAHALTLATPTGTRSYTDPFATTPTPTPYDEGSWTSPRVRTAFGLTELVASWNARTPGGSWIETSVQGVAEDGTTSKWYVLGRWADDDTRVPPDLARRPARRPRDRLGRHPGDPQRAHLRQLPDQGGAAAPRRQHGDARGSTLVGAMASRAPGHRPPRRSPRRRR